MRLEKIIFILATLVLFSFVAALSVGGQCVSHPQGKTALRFHNESSYDVQFLIDEVYATTLPPGAFSDDVAVEPREHILSAMAVISGIEFWVHISNEVPAASICTWNVTDPQAAELMAAARRKP